MSLGFAFFSAYQLFFKKGARENMSGTMVLLYYIALVLTSIVAVASAWYLIIGYRL